MSEHICDSPRVRKFKKKPVVIEARQFNQRLSGDITALALWCGGIWVPESGNPTIVINTLEGTMTAQYGDWIIKGVSGEFYPCKPDIFELTYEPVPDGGQGE